MGGTNPSLIASHVSVTYRVYGAKKIGTVNKGQGAGRVSRLLSKRSPHVGAVREVRAVKDISFVAHHGESIAIVGRNGSGKSTLLRALAGLIPATHGDVYLSGRASLLGVNAVLNRTLSGRRNVMIGGQALGLSPQQVRERLPEIVEFAELEDAIDLPMSAYSSGMAARLRFAISTAAVPEILMIDEALATGDAEFRRKSKRKIDEIRKRAGTVFLVSHSDSTVRSMCDRALWIDKGELIMDGPVNDVMDEYQASRRQRREEQKVRQAEKAKRSAPESESVTPSGAEAEASQDISAELNNNPKQT